MQEREQPESEESIQRKMIRVDSPEKNLPTNTTQQTHPQTKANHHHHHANILFHSFIH